MRFCCLKLGLRNYIYVGDNRSHVCLLGERNPDYFDMIIIRIRYCQCLARGVKVRIGDTGVRQAAVNWRRRVHLNIWSPRAFERCGSSE